MRGIRIEEGGSIGSARSALLLSLLASLLYGSQYVVIKDGVGRSNPLLFGAFAMGIGGVLAWIIVSRRKRLSLRIFRRWEVWAGMLAAASMIGCQYVGLTLSTASVGGLIVGSNVIFVAPLSALLFGEVIGRKRALGVALGLIGLFTITTGWNLSALGTGAFAGNLLLLGASFSIAATYPLTKLAAKHMDYDEWVMSFHLLCTVPLFLLMFLTGGPGEPSTSSWPSLLYVGLLCTSVPTMLWAKGLQSLSLTQSATVLLSESAFAVLLGAVVLSEPLGPVTIIGAIIVFAAIVLAASPDRAGVRKQRDRKSGV